MSVSGTETVYLRSQTVLVTNTRAVLNGATYSMANVTSVRSLRIAPSATWPLITLVAGLGMLIIGGIVNRDRTAGIVGLLLLALDGWLLWRMDFKYVLIIGSAGGEKHAMVSNNRNDILSIVDAVTKAIICRG